jgi:hypothetical protein
MSSSTNISVALAPSLSGVSRNGLQAQLNQLKREHSACVNCETANTQSGQLNIEKLANQIARVETKINQTDQVQTPTTSKDSGAKQLGASSPSRIDTFA